MCERAMITAREEEEKLKLWRRHFRLSRRCRAFLQFFLHAKGAEAGERRADRAARGAARAGDPGCGSSVGVKAKEKQSAAR